MRSLNGRGAVVTGAASGIGEALAAALAAGGAKLLLADRDAARLDAVAGTLRGRGADVDALACDVVDPATADALAARAEARWGGADLVVNNAGVSVVAPAATMPEPDARWQMEVNFWGVVRGCRAFVPQLARRPDTAIVNVASVFALGATPTQSMYAASKAAVRAYSDVLREELREAGVQVLVVLPGGIRTRIVESARVVDLGGIADSHEDLAAQFGKMARTSPEDAAAAIVRALGRGDSRLLIGADARLGDLFARLAPGRTSEWITAFARRARARGR